MNHTRQHEDAPPRAYLSTANQSQSKTGFGTGWARDRVGEVRASSSGSASSHSESCVVTSGLERLLRKSCLKSARKLTTTAAVDIDSYMVERGRENELQGAGTSSEEAASSSTPTKRPAGFRGLAFSWKVPSGPEPLAVPCSVRQRRCRSRAGGTAKGGGIDLRPCCATASAKRSPTATATASGRLAAGVPRMVATDAGGEPAPALLSLCL